MKNKKFVMAYDPKIKRRVPFVVVKGIATSLVTKSTFKYKQNKVNKR